MIQDSSHSEYSPSIYESRPWLKHCVSYVLLDLTGKFLHRDLRDKAHQ